LLDLSVCRGQYEQMKQLLHNFHTGEVSVVDVPSPQLTRGELLIQTRRSLVSAGTERMLVEFGHANLIAKAKSQPAKVQQVLDKVRTDGLWPTLEAVRSKLDQPIPLGYCNAGVVLAIGEAVTRFSVGDRVISNGPHAEIVHAPQNLCARIPDAVPDDEAAFTVLASVGLQGIRLANPQLGERVAVIGLGLVGLMTVQMLIANGCHVLGIDLDAQRCVLARQFGAEAIDLSDDVDPVATGLAFSRGRGVDAVLITASTKSSDPVHQAAQMSRKRGRIVLVGVAGLELSRADFYEKELSFQVSCSYGPGRYDANYEQKGHDYPFGLVRWTEQRNFEAVLALMAGKKLNVAPLISRRAPLVQAPTVYEDLVNDRSLLGVVLTYPEKPSQLATVPVTLATPTVIKGRTTATQSVVVGVIGAGNFASRVLLPILAKRDAVLHTIAAGGGVSAAVAARKFGFQQATSDYHTIIDNPEINTVFILTRHNSHAQLVVEALQAGKHVFVEKPLALNENELDQIKAVLGENASTPLLLRPSAPSLSRPSAQLMVGFNRRFAPLSISMRELLSQRTQPISLIYTVNAGAIPPDHWTQDPKVGGGRIIGEGCHFIDFLRFIVGHPITDVVARQMGGAPGLITTQDKMTITLTFGDGSLGTVHYFANGSKRFPKERVEVFSEGRVLVLDNFKSLKGYGWKGFKQKRLWQQDKGHAAEIASFVERVTSGGDWLIPWVELEEVTLATFEAVKYHKGHKEHKGNEE